jgi:hypothetical protein
MSLENYKKSLQAWGLSDNPFRSNPPDELDRVAAIFHGRSRELDIALPTLYEGRNVLIRGTWGIGKAALIKTLLCRLQQEVAALKETMLVLYLGGIPKATILDFYRAILLAVTQQLSSQDDAAKRIADNLTGMAVQSSKTKTEGGVSIGVISLKLTGEPNATEIREGEVYQQMLFWLNKAEEIYGKVVIAVDDLDKRDIPIVQEIIENSLDLFRQDSKRAFIMTGRGFSDLQEATNFALGIFSEDINLPPMNNDDLHQIAINYLNTVRPSPQDDVAPFTSEVMAKIIMAAQGLPRQLTYICEKFIRKGAMKQYAVIDLAAWDNLWPEIQSSALSDLSPHLRRLLYVAYEQQGISEDLSNATLDQLGVITFSALLQDLRRLESMDLMTRVEDDRGSRFVPTKLYAPPPTNS